MTDSQLRPLSLRLQERAICELNEVPERLLDDINTLREWVEKQPHLRSRTTDQFLVAFLRGSKFNIDKAKNKLEKYYTLQTGIPEVFNNRLVDDEKNLEIIRMGVLLKLPIPEDYVGPCINIIRATIYDTDKYKFADVLRVGMMFGEIMMLEDDNSVISGYIEVMDMQNLRGNHLFQLQPSLLRKCTTFADEGYPTRQKSTHFINVPPPFEFGFRSITAILPRKITNKICVHSTDSETLYEHIPKKYLPVEYGGENGRVPEIIASMEEKFLSYREHFRMGAYLGVVDKVKEIEKPSNTNGNFFGINSLFKKVGVD